MIKQLGRQSYCAMHMNWQTSAFSEFVKVENFFFAKNGFFNEVLFLLLFLSCLSANATDLLEAYRLAKNNDAAFARYSLEGIQQRIPQARAALLPSVTASGSKGSTQAVTAFTDVPPVDRGMRSWAWSLQLRQPLIRLSSVYAYEQSKYIVEQAEAEYESAEQDLILRVAEAYFGVSVAQQVIDASNAEVQALEEQLGQVTRGFKLGTHTLIDVDDTKARLGLARSRQIAAKNDLESKRAELEKITGQRITELNLLKIKAVLPAPQPRDSQTWIDRARLENPKVRAQKAGVAVAEQNIKKSRSEYAPTLDLVASRNGNYASNSLTTPNEFATRANSTQIGIQLNIPIYSGGETNARVAEAIANNNKAQADLEMASRQAATDAQQAYSGVMNGLAQIEALNLAEDSGRNSVNGTRLGYKLGLRINLDVLNAELQLYTAQRDLAKARYDTLLQGLKLKAATGILTPDDLLAVNRMLEK
jgi:outer membrane protein